MPLPRSPEDSRPVRRCSSPRAPCRDSAARWSFRVGGVLTRAFGWEAVFFLNVPLAGAALVLTFQVIEADRARDTSRTFDLPGALAATGAISLLVLALVQGPNFGWSSPAILSAFAAGLVLLASFTVIEVRSRDPLVPPRLLANRVLALAAVIAFMFMATFGSLLYFLSIYFQNVLGYDALETGIAFLLPTTVVVAASTLVGRAVTRFGIRPTLVTALTVGAIGAVAVGLAVSAAPRWASPSWCWSPTPARKDCRAKSCGSLQRRESGQLHSSLQGESRSRC